MLRATLLVATALVAAFAAAPVAEAGHMGPCWHEYIEAVLWFALDHHSFKQLGSDVGNCLDNAVWYLCNPTPWITCNLS